MCVVTLCLNKNASIMHVLIHVCTSCSSSLCEKLNRSCEFCDVYVTPHECSSMLLLFVFLVRVSRVCFACVACLFLLSLCRLLFFPLCACHAFVLHALLVCFFCRCDSCRMFACLFVCNLFVCNMF
jgi:hypothetical protein